MSGLKNVSAVAAFIAMSMTTGCATMFSGTHQVVHVSTEPEGCTVLVDDGRTSTTPCDLSMRRGRTHTLKLVKDGYRSRDVKLHSAFNYVSLANILVFPPLG